MSTKKYRKRRTLKHVRDASNSNNIQVKYPPKEINNYITNIIYINLDRRTDRNESMLKQLKVFDKSKIHRASAVDNSENPILACATSHLNAIKMARDKNFPNVLILEDDAIWENVKKGYDSFKKLVENPYDVIMLGATFKSYNIKTSRINNAQSAASYLINSSYYDKIITRIEDALNDPTTDKNVDVIYMNIQKQTKWLLVVPPLMIQARGMSNIQKGHVNYKKLFYNSKFNPENVPNNSNQSGGDTGKYNIYVFWTGTNKMSSDRKNCLEDLKKVSECNVILVTPDNLKDYIKPEVPLHEAYQYLSETHKADYLRTYFMNYIGGGYSDIKKTTGSWKKSFDDLANSDKWICGYKELGPGGVAYEPHQDKWEELIGNGAYISKPNTPLTNEWYNSMIDLIDTKLEKLKENPAKGPQNSVGSGTGYPMEWNEMLGRIFHRVIYKFKDKIMNTLPVSIFSNYR
jgi:hypothetical protein